MRFLLAFLLLFVPSLHSMEVFKSPNGAQTVILLRENSSVSKPSFKVKVNLALEAINRVITRDSNTKISILSGLIDPEYTRLAENLSNSEVYLFGTIIGYKPTFGDSSYFSRIKHLIEKENFKGLLNSEIRLKDSPSSYCIPFHQAIDDLLNLNKSGNISHKFINSRSKFLKANFINRYIEIVHYYYFLLQHDYSSPSNLTREYWNNGGSTWKDYCDYLKKEIKTIKTMLTKKNKRKDINQEAYEIILNDFICDAKHDLMLIQHECKDIMDVPWNKLSVISAINRMSKAIDSPQSEIISRLSELIPGYWKKIKSFKLFYNTYFIGTKYMSQRIKKLKKKLKITDQDLKIANKINPTKLRQDLSLPSISSQGRLTTLGFGTRVVDLSALVNITQKNPDDIVIGFFDKNNYNSYKNLCCNLKKLGYKRQKIEPKDLEFFKFLYPEKSWQKWGTSVGTTNIKTPDIKYNTWYLDFLEDLS